MEDRREWILHIDGDAFFASCEVSRRPDLFGKAVVVGEERGIVTALTYQAKALGVRRGDPIHMIKKSYPQVTILSSHFELYRKFTHNLAEILIPQVSEFETYSIDECFATLVGSRLEVEEKVKYLKSLVQRKLGITYSFGVSTTKTLAKVASKKNKPDGICFLMNQKEITEALRVTKVDNIWGVGWATSKKLHRYKVETAYDLITKELRDSLTDDFSVNRFQTIDELKGIKHFDIGLSNAHKKSIQSTRSFISKTSNKNILLAELSRNVEVACSQMREDGLVTKFVYVFFKPKIKGQKYIQKSFELPNYTNSDMTIMKYIEHMFDESFNEGHIVYKKSGITLIGLKKHDELEPDLFNTQEEVTMQESKITRLVDGLRNKYGFGIVSLASSVSANNLREKDYERRHKHDVYIEGLPFPFLGIITG